MKTSMPWMEALCHTEAYPHAAEEIEVKQTHISVVFLTGEYVYKIKKPVRLDFLDFSSLEKRCHYCEEEVRLNRRLAAEVYLGVVPITQDGDCIQIEGNGSIIDYAVKMKQLPDEATLAAMLKDSTHEHSSDVSLLAILLAMFHREAERDATKYHYGSFEVVAANLRENIEACESHVGSLVDKKVFSRARRLIEKNLNRLRPLIEERATNGTIRDTHGDLRLDHIYFLSAHPKDLLVLDCIEFNERFRYGDPVADMAFTSMELKFQGRWDLSEELNSTYLTMYVPRAGNEQVLPFYTAYRATVRAKVEGLKLAEDEIPLEQKERARKRIPAYWMLVLGVLEPPRSRPCLLLITGLPGTGKSTLAQSHQHHHNFLWVRSDKIRKELAAQEDPDLEGQPLPDSFYAPEWNERVYAACLERAEGLLRQGGRVIVDANFRAQSQREPFRAMAIENGARLVVYECELSPEIARERLAKREGDVSDADAETYDRLAGEWEPFDASWYPYLERIPTRRSVVDSEIQIEKILIRRDLWSL